MTLTVKHARRILAQPLTFGDPEQIEASDLIALYEKALEVIKQAGPPECPECDGEGKVD